MEKKLLIIASNLKYPLTGGLVWMQKFVEFMTDQPVKTRTLDMSELRFLNHNGKLPRFLAALFFILFRTSDNMFIDHSLFHYFVLPLFLAKLFKRATKYVIICHHTFYVTERSILKKIVDFFLEKWFISNASCIIVPSLKIANDIKSLLRVLRIIVVIEPTGHIKAFEYPKRKHLNRILFVGSIEPRKGIDTIIKALARIKDIDYSCDIVGIYGLNDDYYKMLHKIVKDNELSDHIRFTGRVSDKRLYNYYNDANIFFFPSRHEGYGMVIIEAMSFALPIIAAEIPSTKKFIKHGKNGFLCPINNVECFARYLRILLSDVILQDKMSHYNYELSLHFRKWDDVVRETYAAIKKYLIDR